jgi:hypothetical protein
MKLDILNTIIFCCIVTTSCSQAEEESPENQNAGAASQPSVQIVRQTEKEWERIRSTPSVITGDVKLLTTKFTAPDAKQLHSPLSSLIPIQRAIEIYVPFGCPNLDSVSDSEFIEILHEGILVKRDEIKCNAEGRTCTVRFDDKSFVAIHVLINGREGYVTLKDGTSYWFTVAQEHAHTRRR